MIHQYPWFWTSLALVAAVLWSGCTSDSEGTSDAGVTDSATIDAASPDLPRDAATGPDVVYPTDDAGCTSVTATGCCLGQVVMYCEGGEIKTRDCANNATSTPPMPWKIRCGWHPDYKNYDCGYTEADPSGVNPLWCKGYSPPDAGLPDAADPPPSQCGQIPFQGCCSGTLAKWCTDGKVDSVDCAEVNDTCGWRSEKGYYGCLADLSEDPSGTHPRDCIE